MNKIYISTAKIDNIHDDDGDNNDGFFQSAHKLFTIFTLNDYFQSYCPLIVIIILCLVHTENSHCSIVKYFYICNENDHRLL
ncbi:hypothetical protein DERP_009701 [Dermatophagoides pteronyssinus]|uniref:Uncharacterized protein n=1 Tax=Dermatophagoides pteronyssinus TaxID=6956 RepID=A0ABQ8JB77_DERPT|nr:hypothetical protein DERP_009701 [Dermatophagoides pteronyssinus]